MPRNYKEFPKLHDWSRKLRRNRPTPDRLNKLKSIGFNWEEEHKALGRSQINTWERNIKALKIYYEEKGHFDVRYDENKTLNSWLYRLKKNKPAKKHLEQLEAIGFDWYEESSKDLLDEKWNKKFEELKSFYETNGHFNIPTKYNPTLYRWLYKIKTNKPSKERLDKLQSIGFIWLEEHDKLKRR